MDIELSTVAIQIINTLVLFLILRWLLFKPVTEFLDKRKSLIQETMTQAEQSKEDALLLKNNYEQKLREARNEAHQIVETAHKQGQHQHDEIIGEAKQEAQKIRERAKTEIDMQRDQALVYLRDEMATLAVAAAGQVIGQELNNENHKQLVDKFIERMGEADEE